MFKYLKLTLVLAAIALQGCYATHVNTRATALPEEHSDRQLFMLWGLAPLSDPAGAQCPNGVASVKSKLSAVDILIDAGVGVVAAGVALGTCQDTPAACANRATSLGTLATGLFGTRTVIYHCAAGPATAMAEATQAKGTETP